MDNSKDTRHYRYYAGLSRYIIDNMQDDREYIKY